MFSVPSRRLNLKRVYPSDGANLVNFYKPIHQPWMYKNFHKNKIQQRGFGFQELISKAFTAKNLAALKELGKEALIGRVGTAIKSGINKFSNVKNARPAFKGEKHAFFIEKNRKGKKRLVFANYMGPGTRVAKRLRRGDNPVNIPDAIAMSHDMRYSLAKTGADLLKADQIMIKSLQQVRARGRVPKVNTFLGLRGIQLKNQLENFGIISKTAFLDPLTKEGDRFLARNALTKLEQRGLGPPGASAERLILPGQELRKKIIRKLGKRKGRGIPKIQPIVFKGQAITQAKMLQKLLGKGRRKGRGRHKGGRYKSKYPGRFKLRSIPLKRKTTKPMLRRVTPKMMANMLMTKMFPVLIKEISKKLGVKPKMMGSGLKQTIKRSLADILRKRAARQQKGGIFGITLAGIATLAGIVATLAPLAISAGQFLIPKIVSAFTRKKGKGLGKITKQLIGLSKKVMGKFLNFVCKGRQVGSGFLDFIKGVGKKFIQGITKVIKGIAPVAKFAGSIAVAAAPTLIKHGLPLLIKLLKKRK